MKALVFIAAVLPLVAQQNPAPSPAPAPAATSDAGTPAASPAPASEPALTGWVDLGYVWNTGVGGSYDTYRSIIDIHSGPKLLGADFTFTDPKHRWFDTIQVRATTFGAEPAESLHVEVKKSGLYDFNADYRNFAYYNVLPSYADPTLGSGVFLDQQSFDTRRQIAALSLDIRPGHWWTPYFGWDHDSSSGTGVTAFVTDSNEYPVPTNLRDSTDLYRGGIRFEKPRFHVTLEEGGTAFKSDQSLYQSPGSVNFGNFSTPIFGQTLDLTALIAAYGVRGSSAYSKGLLTASPNSWLDIYGQFLYSQPASSVNYQQADTGNLYLQSQILFYSGEQEILNAVAEQPHTTASIGAEIRPFKHVRIVENWLTDRLHNSGSAASLDTLLVAGSPLPLSALIASTLVTNFSQEALDIFFDPSSKLTLRGGYRYIWGNASYAFLPPEGLASSDQEQLRQNVGVGSVTYRPAQKISVSGEVEARLEQRRVFPDQPLQLPKSTRAGALSTSPDPQHRGRFHAAQQPKPARGNQLRILTASGVALAVLVAAREQSLRSPGLLHARRPAFEHRVSRPRHARRRGFPLPRRVAYRDRAPGLRLAARKAPGTQALSRRLALYLFREPADQLLSASRQALGSPRQPCELVHRMALLRVR